MKRNFSLLFLSLLLFSCEPNGAEISGNMDAYVPIYSSLTDIQNMEVEKPQPTKKAGKIYAYKNYIFQNEVDAGIHIIDNQNKKTPVKIAFLKLPLTTEIA